MNNAISGTIPAERCLKVEESKKAKISVVKMQMLAINNERIMPKIETPQVAVAPVEPVVAPAPVRVETPVEPVVTTPTVEPTVVASAPKEEVSTKYKNIKTNFGLTVYDCETITSIQNGGRKLKVNPVVVAETRKLENNFDMMIPEVKVEVKEEKVVVKEEVKVEEPTKVVTPEPLTRLSRLGEETKEEVTYSEPEVETPKVVPQEDVRTTYTEKVSFDNGNGDRLDGYLGRNTNDGANAVDEKIAELIRQVEEAKKARDAKNDRNIKAQENYDKLKEAQIEKLTQELASVNSDLEVLDSDYDSIVSKTESLDGVIAQIRETMDEENHRAR